MKSILFALIYVMVATIAAAESPVAASGDLSQGHVPSLANEPQKPLLMAMQKGRTVVSSLSDERSLCNALELPETAEPSLASKSSDGFDEFELKIPDYDLPVSDIPLTINSKVEYFLNFFQVSGRIWFAKWLSRSERYIPLMKDILKKEGLPEDLVYLAMIESGFSPHAYSRASAVGPWQFIAGTGKRYSLRIDQWVDERRDPVKSTVAAAMYLKALYGIFNKDWYLAAAGYNAGENKILRAIDMYNSNNFWELSQGAYLKRETKDYVPKLLAAAIIAKEPARYGFADVAYLPPIEFDTVNIPSRTDLELVADLIDVPYETLKELNPELRKWCTPPAYPDYQLKIPKGKKELFGIQYAKVPEDERFKERVVYKRYRTRKGDTIESVARRFGARAEEIAALNGLKRSRIARGKILRVPVLSGSDDVVADSGSYTAAVTKKASKKKLKYYTVRRGDTLYSVSKRFNIPTKTIASWNNLKGKYILKPGKKIIVAKFDANNEALGSRSDDKG